MQLDPFQTLADPTRRRLVEAVIVPAAVSRVMLDLVDRKSLVLAAATVRRDTAGVALERLELEVLGVEMSGALPGLDVAVEALRACVAACDQLSAEAKTVR